MSEGRGAMRSVAPLVLKLRWIREVVVEVVSLHVSLGHKVRSRDEALPNADALLELQEAEEEEGNHGKAGANLHRGSPRPASGHKGGGNGHEGKEEQKEFTQKGTLRGITRRAGMG